jgi:hypothetical protein
MAEMGTQIRFRLFAALLSVFFGIGALLVAILLVKGVLA